MPCTARVLVYNSGGREDETLSAMLESNGYELRYVAPEAPANDPLGEDAADIVIIDCSPEPRNDSDRTIELTRSIKSDERNRRVPLFVLDANDNAKRQAGVLSAGADEYLARPFLEAQLLGRLTSHVRLTTMQHELERRALTARRYGLEADLASLRPNLDLDRPLKILVVGRGDSFASLENMLGDVADLAFSWSPANAMTYLTRAHYDAMIVDMDCQEGDGLRLCTDLRANPGLSTMPVLVFGDRLGFSDAAEPYRAGADDVLYRPLDDQELKVRIRALVAHQRYRESLQTIYRGPKHSLTSDSLTGLYSYGFLLTHLEAEIAHAARSDKNLSLAYFNIKGMAEINRTHGHAVGDHVIRQVGSLIGRVVRGEDVPARYDGDRFCVVMPETSLRSAGIVLNRILSIVNFTEFSAGPKTDIAISLVLKGAAVSYEAGDTPTALIDRAIGALS